MTFVASSSYFVRRAWYGVRRTATQNGIPAAVMRQPARWPLGAPPSETVSRFPVDELRTLLEVPENTFDLLEGAAQVVGDLCGEYVRVR